MGKSKADSTSVSISMSDLRKRAEKLLGQRPEDVAHIAGEDVQRLVHELQIHQIELEMQNEELRKAQEEIEGLLNKYFDLYELAPVGYFTLDRKGLILQANLTGANLLGEQMRYLITRGMSRFVSEGDQNEFYLHLQRVSESREQKRCEIKFVKKDGNEFYVQLDSLVDLDEEDNRTKIRTTMTDISERVKAEKELQEKTDELLALSGAAFEGIAIHKDGVLIRANSQYFQMLGYRPEELLGKQILPLVLAPESIQHVSQQISTGGRGPYEATGLRKDGKRVQLEIRAREIEYEGHTVRVAAVMDITERKRVEEELQKAHIELEARVERRTAELTDANNALRVLLKRVDEDKEELQERILINVKELTLPYLEKLRNSPLNAEQESCLNILESNLSDIVSPFAHRLSSKYLNLTPTEMHVATLIRQGKRTKEIAQLMALSTRTIEVHRQNIRNKLNLKHQKANLRSHLLSLL